MANSTVTAVVVSYNSAQVITPCIEALLGEGVLVLVVDNASSDDTVTVAREAGAEVIANPQNEGYGRGNNIGIDAVQTEYALIINPDAVVEKGAVAMLLQAAASTPEAALFAPVLVEPDGSTSGLRPGMLGAYLSGACLLVRKADFQALGGFDRHIFLFYEDDDLSRRVNDSGKAIQLVEGAHVAHRLGGSSSDNPNPQGQFIVRYHQAWSRFYIAQKYGIRMSVYPWLLRFALKYAFATLTGNTTRKMRYAGSLSGAWDYSRGKTALAKQGLNAS